MTRSPLIAPPLISSPSPADHSPVPLLPEMATAPVAQPTDAATIAKGYADHYLMPYFDPPAAGPPPVDPSVSKFLASDFCVRHRVAPLSDDGQTIEVAIVSPDSLRLADEIRFATDRQMRPLFTTDSVIDRVLRTLYGDAVAIDKLDEIPDFSDLETVRGDEDESDTVTDESLAARLAHESMHPSVDTLLTKLLEHAIGHRASDIHIEPPAHAKDSSSARLRYRIDGCLHEVRLERIGDLTPIMDRIKQLAKLASGASSRPEDGTIGLRLGQQSIDLSVETSPTINGDKLVLRIAHRDVPMRSLRQLGLTRSQRSDIANFLDQPGGILVTTGPRDSGKTTTLHAAINHLCDSETICVSIEDRIKTRLAGVQQIQLRPDEPWTFAAATRDCLNQGADVILVGRLSDRGTCDVCIGGAVAGTRILTSIAARDPLAGLARLTTMGVESASLADAQTLVLGQRLLRRLCKNCKAIERVRDDQARGLGIDPGATVFQSIGCRQCGKTGYRGRVAVFEVIRFDHELAAMMTPGVPRGEIRQSLARGGTDGMLGSAAQRLLEGETSLAEITRAFPTRV